MASKRTTNPRIQLYGLKTLRNMGTMPCVRRYIIGNWLTEICEMKCLDAEAECARDALLDWLRRDIADSSS
ncbi:GH23277 [Drosophila grimshawi]|nr:GH23277 [Drosophila grimshawi]